MSGYRDPQRRPVLYDLKNQRFLVDAAIGGAYVPASLEYLRTADIGVTIEPYDPTILKAANIGVTVQPYNANTLTSGDIGNTVQGYDATILKSSDIGTTVQAYDPGTLKSANIGISVQAYDVDTAKLDVAQTWTAAQTFSSDVVFSSTQAYPKIPQNSKSSSYTLISTDAGKHISTTSGGITIPSGTFAIGDAVSVYNNSTNSQTITQGSGVTLRQAGTANTGNRTLAQYGICTVLCVASNTFVISGAGIS